MVYLQLTGAAVQLPPLVLREEVIAIMIHIVREILHVGVTIALVILHPTEVIGVQVQTVVLVGNYTTK